MHNWGKWYRSDEAVWPNVITRTRAGYYPAYRPVLNWEFRPITDEALEGRRVWLEVRYIGRPLEGHAPWDETPDELAPVD